MTPKQAERLQKKIADVKRALAAEKRKFGVYDDGQGLRYLPPKYFIMLDDYAGALAYMKWFDRHFPDDGGVPDFLFEWTLILFRNGKIKEAELKAFQTFCANTYLFDHFFDRPVIPIVKWEGSNLEAPGYTQYLDYSSRHPEMAAFSDWLDRLLGSADFSSCCNKFVAIQQLLKTEPDWEKRGNLIRQARQLEKAFLMPKP
jgi:hypothetical protein